MLGFALDEQVRGDIPSIGELGVRGTTSRDQRPLNRRRALGLCYISRGRVDVGDAVHLLRITGLA
jgi:hypothetical protein